MTTATAAPATVCRTLPVVENSNESKLDSLSFVYAHGVLEERMGWDCLCGSLQVKHGVHPCVYRDEDGEVSCIAFIWRDAATGWKKTGLVCQADDSTAIDHAMQKMLNKGSC